MTFTRSFKFFCIGIRMGTVTVTLGAPARGLSRLWISEFSNYVESRCSGVGCLADSSADHWWSTEKEGARVRAALVGGGGGGEILGWKKFRVGMPVYE